MKPSFNLEDIKATTDPPTYQKAIDLYNKKKIIQFKEELNGYSAVVKGSELYDVYVDTCQCNKGDCNCYLGQHDVFCKHMVAVAIYAVMNGKKLTTQDENILQGPVCNELTKNLTKEEVDAFKKEISCAMKFIKPYTGGSKKWFIYQDSLCKGCYFLSNIVSQLPVSVQSTEILINILLRLDKKLYNGVDDSDGTVGSFMQEIVAILQEYAKINPDCISTFRKLCDKDIFFDWSYPLIEIVDEQ